MVFFLIDIDVGVRDRKLKLLQNEGQLSVHIRYLIEGA